MDVQPGPIAGAHCPFLEPTFYKASPFAAKRHASSCIAATAPVAISYCTVPLQPDILSLPIGFAIS